MIREPEDLPMITPLNPRGLGEWNKSYWTLNTKGPHAASAHADLFLFFDQFQIKDDLKAARIEAARPLTRPLATLSRWERVNCIPSPFGRRIG